MQSSLKSPVAAAKGWVYASLAVLDGQRRLKPAQVGPDFIMFPQPPQIVSGHVEIIVTNGDAEYRRRVQILPHDSQATEIPIRLLPE
jgi:hypothetical protein